MQNQQQQQVKETFTSKLLLSDEDILKLGIPKHQVEMYRRKYYQVSN